MSRSWSAAALAAIITAGSAGPAAQAPTLPLAMREKLTNAQRLLEPMLTGDYEAIARTAELLSRISDKEIASWQEVSRPEYTQQATQFLLSVDGLREAAAKRDIEMVQEEYTSLLTSCIRCHTYVRASREQPR